MKVLLDTHVFIWYTTGDAHLSQVAAMAINDPANRVYLSAISAWEMAIKIQTGKLTLTRPLEDLLRDHVHTNAMTELPLRITHARLAAALPPHHRDPFDRSLIAQAIVEGMAIITIDSAFNKYDVKLIW